VTKSFPDLVEQQALISRELKLLYVPTPKVGCTSMKWAMAVAEGTVSAESAIAAGGETRDQLIHDPAVHGLAAFASLRPNERQIVLEDPSWVRLCVTRDPYSRLLSGWTNRVLLSGVDRRIGNIVFIPESTDQHILSDLGERFRDFVRKLLGPKNPDVRDPHFRPQFQLLRPDVFPYTDVVDVKELDEFVARFVASSSERRQFNLLSMNRSMRIDPQGVFDAETGKLVDSFFAADFEQFSYQRLQFAEVAEPLRLSTREMDLISIVKAQSNRVDEMRQLMERDPRLRSRVLRRVRAIRRRVRTRR
jgi:hypothetical protein